MPVEDHIKAFRLFDRAQAQSVGKGFQLLDWEEIHLLQCPECQAVFAVFARQFQERLPSLFNNGEISPTEGYYKNLCCDLEAYITAGTVFPDCKRHKKLPTVWRQVKAEEPPGAADKRAGE